MITDETICEITRDVFSSLGYEPYPVPSDAANGELVSSISIDGPETAVVEVHLPQALALQLARKTAGDSAGDDMMRDLAGEIANMIGGIVKSLLAGPNRLSLPRVCTESAVGTASGMQTVDFECELGRFRVSVKLGEKS